MVKKIPLAGVTVEFKADDNKGVLRVGSTKVVLERTRVLVGERRGRVVVWRSGSRGLVYVCVSRKLLPGEGGCFVDYKSFVERSFLVQAIKSTAGEYLIIVTPGSYSYERVIIYDDKIAIEYEGAGARIVDSDDGFSVEFSS